MAEWPTLDALGQRTMTHQAEQPNPAQPYLNDVRNFAGGGISGVLQGRGVELPGWLNSLNSVVRNPDFNMAMGMTMPLKGASSLVKRQSLISRDRIDVDLKDAKKWEAAQLKELEGNKSWMTPDEIDYMKKEIALHGQFNSGNLSREEFETQLRQLQAVP